MGAHVHLDDVVVVQTTGVSFYVAGLVCDALFSVSDQVGLDEVVEVGRDAPD